jgi:hypothetical protein
MISITADKALPGDDLRVRKNKSIRVHVRAWAPPSIGAPKKLDLIAHGQVLRSAESTETGKSELAFDYDLRASDSQWLAARVESHNGALAHTSPIYVLVDGRNFVNRAQAGPLAEKRMRVLDFVADRLKTPAFVRNFGPGEVDALTSRIEEARSKYKQIASAVR